MIYLGIVVLIIGIIGFVFEFTGFGASVPMYANLGMSMQAWIVAIVVGSVIVMFFRRARD